MEAKPRKYQTRKNVIAWEKRLLSRFVEGDFDSIILHRFLYKAVKEYVEDPMEVLTEVKRILPEGGVLVVNSFLLDDKTKNFRSAESFYTEEEMKNVLLARFGADERGNSGLGISIRRLRVVQRLRLCI